VKSEDAEALNVFCACRYLFEIISTCAQLLVCVWMIENDWCWLFDIQLSVCLWLPLWLVLIARYSTVGVSVIDIMIGVDCSIFNCQCVCDCLYDSCWLLNIQLSVCLWLPLWCWIPVAKSMAGTEKEQGVSSRTMDWSASFLHRRVPFQWARYLHPSPCTAFQIWETLEQIWHCNWGPIQPWS